MKSQSSKVTNYYNYLFCIRIDVKLVHLFSAGDVQSRTGRQFVMMPAIDPYAAGLLMNHQQQQQTPSNTFSGWLSSSPSNIPLNNSDSSLLNFDDDQTLLSSRQQQQYPCGRGPAALPQRQIVGIVGGTEAEKNSWPFIVSCSFSFSHLTNSLRN
jgi:hypothetical protein